MMNFENELAELSKYIFDLNEMHEEYTVNGESLSIDGQKQDEDTYVITIKRKENTKKKNFESWCNELDDEMFQLAFEKLQSKYKDVASIYDSDNWEDLVDDFKKIVAEIKDYKIQSLIKEINRLKALG